MGRGHQTTKLSGFKKYLGVTQPIFYCVEWDGDTW